MEVDESNTQASHDCQHIKKKQRNRQKEVSPSHCGKPARPNIRDAARSARMRVRAQRADAARGLRPGDAPLHALHRGAAPPRAQHVGLGDPGAKHTRQWGPYPWHCRTGSVTMTEMRFGSWHSTSVLPLGVAFEWRDGSVIAPPKEP